MCYASAKVNHGSTHESFVAIPVILSTPARREECIALLFNIEAEIPTEFLKDLHGDVFCRYVHVERAVYTHYAARSYMPVDLRCQAVSSRQTMLLLPHSLIPDIEDLHASCLLVVITISAHQRQWRRS